MTIRTIPSFFYVDSITSFNNCIDILEPNGLNIPLVAKIIPGSRSLTALLQETQRALNEPTNNQYSVTIDRETRLVTISSDDTFDLLFDSGSNSFASPFSLLGFSGDQTGANSYTATSPIGRSFVTQFLPQSFDAFEDNAQSISPAVRESSTGIIEVVSFGRRRFMEMSLKYITNNKRSKGAPVRNNPIGLEDARSFFEFAITKVDMEFMINKDDPDNFVTVLLEKTPESSTGTAYKLKEMRNRKLIDYFETGNITFRKVER